MPVVRSGGAPHEARQQALKLHAAGSGVPFPPFDLPPGLAATSATPTTAQDLLAAANAIADLLPPSPWEAVARARLSGA